MRRLTRSVSVYFALSAWCFRFLFDSLRLLGWCLFELFEEMWKDQYLVGRQPYWVGAGVETDRFICRVTRRNMGKRMNRLIETLHLISFHQLVRDHFHAQDNEAKENWSQPILLTIVDLQIDRTMKQEFMKRNLCRNDLWVLLYTGRKSDCF